MSTKFEECNLDLIALQSETPSGDDIDSRERVIKRIDTLVRAGLSQFTGMHVETYGSYTSGLFTPQGDLDIAIEGVLQLRNSGQGQRYELYLEERQRR